MTVPFEYPFQLKLGRTIAAKIWPKENAPVFIALHGWLDNCASFNRLAPQLDATIVALDLAGHGLSYHRSGYSPYHLWDDLVDLAEVIDSLSSAVDGQKVGLMGHSRGAIVAALFAATRPEIVAQLLLIDGLLPEPVNAGDAPAQMAKALEAIDREVQRQFPVYESVEAAANVRLQGMFPLSYEAALEMAGRGTKAVAGGVTWRVDPKLLAPSMIKLSADQTAAFAQAITAPTSLILASNGMPKLFPRFNKVLAQLTHIEQQLFEGSHHLHMESESEQVAQLFNERIAEQLAAGNLRPLPEILINQSVEFL